MLSKTVLSRPVKSRTLFIAENESDEQRERFAGTWAAPVRRLQSGGRIFPKSIEYQFPACFICLTARRWDAGTGPLTNYLRRLFVLISSARETA